MSLAFGMTQICALVSVVGGYAIPKMAKAYDIGFAFLIGGILCTLA